MNGDVAAMLLAAIAFPYAKKKEREHKRAARGKRGPDTRKVGPIAGLADFPDFRNLITCYAARLSSPHAYIMLLQRGACGRTLGGSAKSELDTQCRIRDNP